MGKGTIISGGTDGQYQVQINFYRDKINAEISRLTDGTAALEITIAGMDDGPDKNLVKLQKTGLEKRKQFLEDNMSADETISAWCADLTEDLSGSVGTIEVPGERGTVLVQAGYDGNAVYSAARDGQLLPAIAATPAQYFYNLAMFPGWQKWMPTYRFGTITAITDDRADVNLDSASSSQQSINVNQATALSDMTIDYMSCNGSAFEIGDDVLIEFAGQDWTTPKIIGFKDHPAPCEIEYLLVTIHNTGSTEILYLVWDLSANEVATITHDGDVISFPCEYEDISGWLASAEYHTELFSVNSNAGINLGSTSCYADPGGPTSCYDSDSDSKYIYNTAGVNAEYTATVEYYQEWSVDGWDHLVENDRDNPLYWFDVGNGTLATTEITALNTASDKRGFLVDNIYSDSTDEVGIDTADYTKDTARSSAFTTTSSYGVGFSITRTKVITVIDTESTDTYESTITDSPSDKFLDIQGQKSETAVAHFMTTGVITMNAYFFEDNNNPGNNSSSASYEETVPYTIRAFCGVHADAEAVNPFAMSRNSQLETAMASMLSAFKAILPSPPDGQFYDANFSFSIITN